MYMVHAVVIHRRNFIEKIFTLFRTVSSFCLISEDLQNDVLMVSEVLKIHLEKRIIIIDFFNFCKTNSVVSFYLSSTESVDLTRSLKRVGWISGFILVGANWERSD